MATVGLGVGVPVLVLFLVAVVVRQRMVINRQKKKREPSEKAEFNPVYATYEIHDDPVAEVRHQNFNVSQASFQVHDQNPDYGVAYKGAGMSKTTDVNPYYDY